MFAGVLNRTVVTQIIQTSRKWDDINPADYDSGSDWWLDGSSERNKPGGISTATVTGLGIVQQADKFPGVPQQPPEAKANDVFRTYIQYRPQPLADSIDITLGRVDWSWAIDAQDSNGQWNIPMGTVSTPSWHNDDNFPQWQGVTPGAIVIYGDY
jgi:hypothetical protein